MRSIAIVTVATFVAFGSMVLPSAAASPDAKTCPAAPAQVRRDLSYVKTPVSDLQRLDLYAPARAASNGPCVPAPVVVWVHGGGWATGDKRNATADKVRLFNDLGYVFVSVNYRLAAPFADANHPRHPDLANDVGASIAWLEANAHRYGGDGTRIALLGHSAGAHLVALVGTDPRFIERAGDDAADLRCVGSYDTASYDLVQRSSETRLVENAFGSDIEVWKDASPVNHLEDRTKLPEFQVVVRGSPSRRASESAFADAVQAAGGTATVIDAAGLSHGDVNRLIGAPGESVMTPAVTEFVTGCLGQRA